MEIWPFEIRHIKRGAFGAPFWGKGEVVEGHPLERAMVVSYTHTIVNIALSLTIRPQLPSNAYDAQFNRGWVNLYQNFRVFPLEWTICWGFAKSKHSRLTDGGIIFQDLKTISRYLSVTDGQTDGQTDGRTTHRSNTALCVAPLVKN